MLNNSTDINNTIISHLQRAYTVMVNNSTDINNTITSHLQRAYTVMVNNSTDINNTITSHLQRAYTVMVNNSTDINNTITYHLQRAYTVMVNNCTNINKKNNRLSPEHTENRKDLERSRNECCKLNYISSLLYCDCLQFHQYQQNCHHEKTTTYDAGYPGPDVAKIHTDALM
jgi:ribose 1,5-bisphosphokinase PhnN